MNTIFNTGVSGMVAYQKKMDLTAHNIANVNTPGYKPERADFESLIHTDMDVNVETDDLRGHGVRQRGTTLDLGQGMLEPTGNPLDFAITGEGFFAVDNNGVIEYTRNGSFEMSLEGYWNYLVTKDGRKVLDNHGRYVTINMDPETGLPDYNALKNSIGIFRFGNPYGLGRAGSGRFLQSELSGPAMAVYRSGAGEIVRAGYLETSAVEIGEEMVGLIEAQRAFQLSARIVRAADEIEEIINNLR